MSSDLHAGADVVPRDAARMTFAELTELLGARALIRHEALSREWLPVRSVRRGEAVFRAGDRFDSLYVVRSGFLKTRIPDGDGGEQVLGFPMRGDALGMDGIASGLYGHDAVAVDTASVASLYYAHLMRSVRLDPGIMHLFCEIFSREMSRADEMMSLLGSMSAAERLATFLLHLGRRFSALGYSTTSFQLRMRREDIASHLGLSAETISRNFSLFARSGLIAVNGKEVSIKDLAGLRAIAHESMRGGAPAGRPRLGLAVIESAAASGIRT
jgi:CRP/FNR family transcriptional regulator, anaerobic regulatory protein